MRIESTANPFVKQVKRLHEKKYRKEQNQFLIEGLNVTLEFLTYQPQNLYALIVTDSLLSAIPDGFEDKLYVVSEKVFSALSETKSPQGVMAVGYMPADSFAVESGKRMIYLDHVNDPGNVGTIIRTADAFGADCVVLSPSCADPYGSKTVRSAMGSLFHVPVICESEYLSVLKQCKSNGYAIIAGCLDAEKKPCEFDFTKQGTVICVGNEAHGVSCDLIALCTEKVKIPIPGKAESLNVAVAGAILMYESVRQEG